jgi:hypothetical protein
VEKDCYKEIIQAVSKKFSKNIISEEKDLVQRATLIDQDIAGIVQDIGLKTTENVLKNTRDEVIAKKNKKGW